MLSGPGTVTFGAPNLASTTANFSIPGTYQLQLSVSDTLLTGVGLVTVTVNTAGSGPSLVLSPASSGPRVINSVQQLTAKLKDITGSPVVAATVSFTVTGVNPSKSKGDTLPVRVPDQEGQRR